MCTSLEESVGTVDEPLWVSRPGGFELFDGSITSSAPLNSYFGLRLEVMRSHEFYKRCPVICWDGKEAGRDLQYVESAYIIGMLPLCKP